MRSMNKKALCCVLIGVLLLLVACESKTNGKRIATPETSKNAPLTGAVVLNTPKSSTPAPTKTAAEMLKELQKNPAAIIPTNLSKVGNFYPPIGNASAKGKEALKEKTRALFQRNLTTPMTGKADTKFGPRYTYN